MEREPIAGVWGQSPQWSPGAEPLVGPEAESLLAFRRPVEAANLPYFCIFFHTHSLHVE